MKEKETVLLAAGVSGGVVGAHISNGSVQTAVLCLTAVCLAILTLRCVAYAHDLETMLSSNETQQAPYSAPGRVLLGRINEREAKLKAEYSASMSDSQSRINALQNQINPHFLYNTLECIRSEAIIQGCDNIAHMSNALASFFRYSISRRENIVTLRDELNNIRNYFLIQQFRFEDRFFLDIELDEENTAVQECLLPKMTIQPIVENSIFHGLEPKPGQGHVKIRVRSTENLLHLVITDDGIGMDAETLARMRANMERKYAETNADRTAGHGNGIAMHNVNQRIKLIFGPEYGVQIYSSDGQGTQVEVLVPIIRSREEMQDAEGILL